MAILDRFFQKCDKLFYVDIPAYLDQELVIDLEDENTLIKKNLFHHPKDNYGLDFYYFNFYKKEFKH